MGTINSQVIFSPGGRESYLDKREDTSGEFANDIFEHCTQRHATRVAGGEISRLSGVDADLFRRAFQQEELCYANSWLYLLRSTRSERGEWGYKFVGDEALLALGHRNGAIFLVHPMGTGRFAATLELCCTLRERVACPIILKKVDEKLYAYLSSTNLFDPQSNNVAFLEEEAFPENVLLLDRLYGSASDPKSHMQPLLRKVKRFEKGPLRLQVRTDMALLEDRPGYEVLFGPNPEKYWSYQQIIREVSSHKAGHGRYSTCLYVDEDERVHGLYIAEVLQDQNAGLYCAVSSRAFPGITEWMDYDFFRRLFAAGIRALYLGGSETSGVDAYIKKLLPASPSYLMRPIQMTC